ncbi:MAG TPA: geranylgeranylglyceryl/heptaprenylglyceryl phosphate synthase [Saprospiraceae bacterium]|nr:geranylgeranylglyceryl/heptaprenylglyceryl phosphate synthase [Saprospiraceae bacterium]
MPNTSVYQRMQAARRLGCKQVAVLVDPDKATPHHLSQLLELAQRSAVDYFFVGGSLVMRNSLDPCLLFLKQPSTIPCVLFPGSVLQISKHADALLLLSLISGRNPEMLIGQHVIAAPYLRASGLEVISTGYMVIDGGAPTTVSYISGSSPIPADKSDIAACTAMAGDMLGLKTTYLDAGSGAKIAVSEAMITAVNQHISTPLIVGGGIRTPEKAYASGQAGADIIVIGNRLEQEPTLLPDIVDAVRQSQQTPEY